VPAAIAPPPETPKQDKARTTTSTPGTAAAAGTPKRGRGRPPKKPDPEPAAAGTYAAQIDEWLEGLTIVAALPLPPTPLRDRVRLQASLVDQHRPGLTRGIDLAAAHNATVRRGIESLTNGSAGWVLPAVALVIPFAYQSLAVWRGEMTPEARYEADAFARKVSDELKATAEAMRQEGATDGPPPA
jgi:hypothetical protein